LIDQNVYKGKKARLPSEMFDKIIFRLIVQKKLYRNCGNLGFNPIFAVAGKNRTGYRIDNEKKKV